MKKIYLLFIIVFSFIIYNKNVLAFDNIEYNLVSINDTTSVKAETFSADFLDICDKDENPEILSVFRLLGVALIIVKIVVPILLIVYGMLDLSNAVIASKDDAIKISSIKLGKRIVLGLLVFLTPSIILGLFDMIDGLDSEDSSFKPCLNCLLDPNGDCPKDISFTK